jgi:superfamily II DNA or RNA helicase
MATTLQLPSGLWEHQERAIETAQRYLTAKNVKGRSALLTMPTGTGKTGVIAVVTTALPSGKGHRLVLTPWRPLVEQLLDDLRERFWARLEDGGVHVKRLPVRRLPASTHLEELSDVDQPTIFVATIAAISAAARRSDQGAYDLPQLFTDFGCVIVDEGHYEPAPEWSQAIRRLERPTILLTATPYRNDEKFFNVGHAWRYRFPHWDAEKKLFLRTPDFTVLDDAAEPERFAAKLVEQVETRFPDDDLVRVIVRCKTHENIRLMVRALEDLGQTAIGVHEKFPKGELSLSRTVPKPSECEARYWVHQNKLIEGIDDPRFKVLAFYEALRNDRAIVQQIGRVLRNPTRDRKDRTALVLSRGDRDIERTWKAYRSFDEQDDAESVATLPELVERVLEVQPLAFYYDGAYRVRVDLNSQDAWQEFAFPLRTRVYRQSGQSSPTLDDLEAATRYEWGEIDRAVFATQSPDDTTIIIPFVTAENSRLLRAGTFIEPEFGYTVLRQSGHLLFVYDSRGRTPEVVEEHFRPLRPPDLQTLFPSTVSHLTSVSLLNTDIGRQAARSRQVRAAAIDDLAPDLADYAYVCTIAEGYTEIANERFRRYVGLSRSRVSDFRVGERDFAAYQAWLEALAVQLSSGGRAAVTFTRYATYVDEPADKEAAHVLLDVDPAAFENRSTGATLEIEDLATDVDGGGFLITANGQSHDAAVFWETQKARYEVVCSSLQDELFVTSDGERREFIAAINAEQTLRVVPKERTSIYAHGNFFKPIIPATRIGSFRLLDILHGTHELASASSEKGSAIVNNDWDPLSVFGLISALAPSSGRQAPSEMRAILPTPDFVLCTDQGTEVADFLVTQGSRVAFVHAKASGEPRYYSASALHDVASQAIKNLPHLQPLTEVRMNTATWTGQWSANGVAGKTHRRRQGAFASGPAMWKHIRSVVAVPASEREVWLVLGQSLSKSELIKQATKRPPAAEAIQVFALLQTTWGAVSQLGARLRIFCSP